MLGLGPMPLTPWLAVYPFCSVAVEPPIWNSLLFFVVSKEEGLWVLETGLFQELMCQDDSEDKIGTLSVKT